MLTNPATVFTTASSIALLGFSSRRSQRAVDLNSTEKSSSFSMISATVRKAAPPTMPSCSATLEANSASTRIRSTTLSAIVSRSGSVSTAMGQGSGRIASLSVCSGLTVLNIGGLNPFSDNGLRPS